ncbi:MAG: CvpA family protein [Synergistaceae bacterium]
MSFIDLHWLDTIFLLLGLYFIIRGCFRGLIGELITLIGFISSAYISFKYSGEIAKTLGKIGDLNTIVAQIITIFLIWAGITLIVIILKKVFACLVEAVSLGALDKLLGICSGLCKLTISVYVFLIIGLLLTPLISPVWMTESSCLRYAGRHWPYVRKKIIQMDFFPQAYELPNGTLEQILRPYRTGNEMPEGLKNETTKNRNNKMVI